MAYPYIGGDREKTPWIAGFRDFCSQLQIDSKETGVGPLVPYGSQEIDEGWQRGVRLFLVLKSC